MLRRHLLAAVLATLAIPTTALAGPQWGVVVQWGSRPAPNVGFNEGHLRGTRAGQEDARRGNRFYFEDEFDYRNADYGYRSQYGSREYYRSEYRRGFAIGYEAGFASIGRSGRGGYDGRGGWSDGRGGRGYNGRGGRGYAYDLAAQQGFNDGYEAGFDDGRDGRRFDPISESRYRNGDRGYQSSYGSRELYKARYRESFREGYDDGYRESTRYGGY